MAFPHNTNVIRRLIEMAKREGYDRSLLREGERMLSFWRGDVRVNVYYTTMTVGTCLDHPKQGKTQLFRRDVTEKELEMILRNPRVHTHKGYKTRL